MTLRFSCAGRNPNLVVNAGLKSESSTVALLIIINTANSDIGYLKHSGHNKDLILPLKQGGSTQQNSKCFMLQSVQSEIS